MPSFSCLTRLEMFANPGLAIEVSFDDFIENECPHSKSPMS